MTVVRQPDGGLLYLGRLEPDPTQLAERRIIKVAETISATHQVGCRCDLCNAVAAYRVTKMAKPA